MLSKIFSIGLKGIEGYPVLVELDMANGLPAYTTVGLPDSAVRESRERVASAVRNSGFRFPSRKITVNLAPAQARKEGTQFDLPIALAVLSASGQIPGEFWPEKYCFVGELALDGTLRPVPGVLAMALEAKSRGYEALVVPTENLGEAGSCGVKAWGAASLREVTDFLSGEGHELRAGIPQLNEEPLPQILEDIADVKGQALAKRALEIAAAGGHNLLFIGAPGVGKSMMAKRLPGILPPLSEAEALEVTRIYSLGRKNGGGLVRQRPFRAPHHSATSVALIGGGPLAHPGEVSLAHGGVLFLDELAEFNRQSLEALRQPLEEGKVTVLRARGRNDYPARFMLVAATNPCPCGWLGHPTKECRCSPPAIERYLSRLSGPLLDRIDLQVEMSPLPFDEWATAQRPAQSSAAVRDRVLAARERQKRRFTGENFAVNAAIASSRLNQYCALSEPARAILKKADARLSLSARGLDRLLRVARTIADLSQSAEINCEHISEAVQYRSIERLIGAVGRRPGHD